MVFSLVDFQLLGGLKVLLLLNDVYILIKPACRNKNAGYLCGPLCPMCDEFCYLCKLQDSPLHYLYLSVLMQYSYCINILLYQWNTMCNTMSHGVLYHLVCVYFVVMCETYSKQKKCLTKVEHKELLEYARSRCDSMHLYMTNLKNNVCVLKGMSI